jgi:hypothetical protein
LIEDEDEDEDEQIMDGLYPIIRRKRRPLVLNQPAVAVVQPRFNTSEHESEKGEQEGTEGLPHGQSGRSSTSLTGEQGEAEPTTNIQQPTPNSEGESRTTTSTRTSTIKNPEERHARKAKEA